MTNSLKVLVFILFGFGLSALSQEDVNRFSHANSSDLNVETGFAVAHPNKDECGIFLIDLRTIHAYQLNEKLDVKNKIEVTKSGRKYKNIIGQYAHDKGYTLFFDDRKEGGISYLTFDFEARGIGANGTLPVSLKKKKILVQLTHKGNFILLVMDRKSPQLSLLQINPEIEFEESNIDVSQMEMVAANGRVDDFNRVFAFSSSEIAQINTDGTNYPTSLTESAARYKAYRTDNKLYLTFDNSRLRTQIVTIDLDNATADLQDVAKPEVEKGVSNPTNSFLFEHYLAQIALGKDELQVSVTDLRSNEVKFSKSYTKDHQGGEDEFLQKKSWKEELKTLDTPQFFRKIANNEIAISTEKTDNGYVLTYGSWNKAEEGSSSAAAAGFGAVLGGALGAMITYAIAEAISPDFRSYSKHANGKTVYTSASFNSSFEVDDSGVTSPNLFQQLDDYMKTREKVTPLVLFKHQDNTILGLWDPKHEIMELIEF